MDDRVQQCPNCGAAVLANALYCVTCGIRLPEPPGRSGAAETTTANAWQPPAEDVWIGETPALDEEEHLEEEPAPGAVTPPDSSVATGEPEPEAGDVIALPSSDTGDMRAETGPGATEVGGDQPYDREREVVGPEGELATSLTEDAAGEVQPEASHGQSGQAIAMQPTMTGDDHERSFATYGEEAQDADDFEPAGWDDSDDNLNDVAEPESMDEIEDGERMTDSASDVQTPLVSGSDQPASLERATALLDELRQLLPGLAAPVASEPGPDLTSLRDQAIVARGERSFDDFASLREAIHDAVHRPRDIEVVLRLSQHAEDIDALLKERDRLQSAFDELLRGLEQ